MTDTKEEILTTALHLFARDGYEAVSVSSIAGALGMTKGALYKHYASKRDIFDHIVARMYEIDAERARQYGVPEESCADAPETYRAVALDNVKSFTAAQFQFWTEDDFGRSFRRMLTLEQYRDPEMAQLYQGCLAAGPAAYVADIFRESMAAGLMCPGDPEQLAAEFYAPLFYLISVSDHTPDREPLAALLERHIARFFRRCAVPSGEKEFSS